MDFVLHNKGATALFEYELCHFLLKFSFLAIFVDSEKLIKSRTCEESGAQLRISFWLC